MLFENQNGVDAWVSAASRASKWEDQQTAWETEKDRDT
jgi:hypothetical protein